VTTRQDPPPPWHPLAWADALAQFGRTELAGGIVLVVALAAALLWANLDPHSYSALWNHQETKGLRPVPTSLRTVADGIDNGLMTIFFLAIGLEIAREVAEGSLQDTRNALLPVVAALGGMAGAAAVYLAVALVRHPPGGINQGWGIPMATDAAFTLGAVALLGTRVPRPLRTFVLALAVADDVFSVIVLAFVASTKIHYLWLAGAVGALALVGLARNHYRQSWWPFVWSAIIIWYLFVRAGIEPTLAGAFVGLLVPMAGGAKAGNQLEGPVHAVSSYVILPLFVLANAGVTFTASLWHSTSAVAVVEAIVSARTVGKMAGITLGVALMVGLGVCNLPERTTWRHMVGVSLLCGMGITVPLLFAHAVFDDTPLLFAGSQVGLLLGTLAAAVLGSLVLLTIRRPKPSPEADRATVPATKTNRPPPGDLDHPKEG
jgi:NhaA family Na+:H+ antiporter